MENIKTNLEKYLETKRRQFPRFYFISNDELLLVLADATNFKKVEKHLSKIFDNIYKLNWGPEESNTSNPIGIFSHEMEELSTDKIRFKSSETIEHNLNLV